MTTQTIDFPSNATIAAPPLQIELRFLVRQPPAEVFDLVTRRLPEWFGAIHEVRWDHARSAAGPGQMGACSERVCVLGGKSLREEIVSYEAGRRYTYRADLARSELKMPIREHLGSFAVDPSGEGSVVLWRQHFTTPWYAPAALVRWQMRDRMMRPAVDAMLAKHGGRWLET